MHPRHLALLLATLTAGLVATSVPQAAAQPCSDPGAFCLGSLDGTLGLRYDAVDSRGLAGLAVAFAGDLNGDGFDDLAIAEPGADGGAGAVYLIYGRAGPFGTRESLVSLAEGEGTRFSAPPGVAGLGWSLARVGDLDGDGLDDLAIGAPGSDGGAGRVIIIFGREGGFPASQSLADPTLRTLTLRGAGPTDGAGEAVSSAGDLNADGHADLAIGAPGAGVGGVVYVLYGRGDGGFGESLTLGAWPLGTGLTLVGGLGQGVGASVAGAPAGRDGDANGDGFDDLLLGAPLAAPAGRVRAGRAYLVFGGPGVGSGVGRVDLQSMPATAGVRFDGLEENLRVGMEVAFLGDLNADGRADMGLFSSVAGPSGSLRGRGWVRFGRAPGDGFDPVEALWVDDATRGFEVRAERTASRQFGSAAAAVGDFDGDGVDDALIGSRNASFTGLSEAGRGFLLRGAASWPDRLELGTAEDRWVGIDGDTRRQYAGASVAGLGDFNGDGLDDIVLGGPGLGRDGDGPGAVYVVFGGALGPPACPADIDRDGVLTVLDFLAYQNLFAAGDVRADLDGDGALTLLDFLAYQNLFAAGCP